MTGSEASVGTDPAHADTRATTLPFAWTVNVRKVALSRDKFDYPVRQAVIDGEVWVVYIQWGDNYKEQGSRVIRLKGPDLEHLQRQPDGICDFGGSSGHMGCGLWCGAFFRDRSICLSACTDLARQDWTPMAKLLEEPGNAIFGFTLADEKGVDPVVCGRTLLAYNYWIEEQRALEITLKEGSTPVRYKGEQDGT